MTTVSTEILTDYPTATKASNVIFNSPEFTGLSQGANILTLNKGGISLSFQLEGDTALSLPACPYAGLDTGISEDQGDISDFILAATKTLEEKKIEQIIIKESPFFVKSQLLHDSYINSNFQVKNTEINHHLDISYTDFMDSVHFMEKRKIKK
ncbi:MAG: hypothetical protein JXQ96_23765, partial [Cyclobacteriaceae bacterium]